MAIPQDHVVAGRIYRSKTIGDRVKVFVVREGVVEYQVAGTLSFQPETADLRAFADDVVEVER